MKYNFDIENDRLNTNSIKWDVKENELPMWIADTDFQTSNPIKETLLKISNLGMYGYSDVPDDFYSSYINFWKENYNLTFTKQDMMFVLGVVPCISSSVRALTDIGDNIVILTPTYNIFFNSIINNHRNVIQVPLLYVNHEYSINFDSLEKAFKVEKTKMIILANPANPISRIWTYEELKKIGELAYKYHVYVLSDEIHSQLTRPNCQYIPFAVINDINKNNCIMAISPTKTFNIAGIHSACIVIYNKDIYKKVNRQINTDEVAEPNIFSCEVAIAGFKNSKDYIDQLREYIFNNVDYASNFIKEEIPDIYPIYSNATYLLWIDISKISSDSDEFTSFLRKETGLILSSGKIYGGNGNNFVRMNLATNYDRIKDGLNRLKIGVEKYKQLGAKYDR